jgi:hypothetical protein
MACDGKIPVFKIAKSWIIPIDTLEVNLNIMATDSAMERKHPKKSTLTGCKIVQPINIRKDKARANPTTLVHLLPQPHPP